ncbi:electron transport complex subunit RsxG [Shewanella maritima]|uniref:electron transport complex subunit RsxG n=1 Tax=Shewanella maritima TaxID=2520507 RepID=UPI003734C7C4
MLKNGLILGGFALCCTGLVALVNALTIDTIKAQQQKQLAKTLTEIIAEDLHDNVLSEACILVHDEHLLGSKNPLPAYIASKDGQAVALAIEAIAPDGYNGDIKLIIGVDNHNKLLGVRTLTHQETPGLGDKIELRKSDWVMQFTGMIFNSTGPQWAVKKDGGEIDQFTGATITPRAYIKAINNALLFVENNRNQLYRSPITCEANHE